ncbi:MAG: GAF domain-containing protein [Actinobacteria bacterium]|nr:MAG: GAF domain-containing protein [Actinomycetota bacterium]
MTQPIQAWWLDAVPLLVAASAYLGVVGGAVVGAALAVAGLRGLGRRRVAAVDVDEGVDLPAELGRAHDALGIGLVLLKHVERRFGVDVGALILVADDAAAARGLVGRTRGAPIEGFDDVAFDLRHEASGVATVVHDAAPFAVYDAVASPALHRELVEKSGIKSAAFIPLIAEERVAAVLVVGTTGKPRAFTAQELNALQVTAAEAALALDRARTTSELAEALRRERRRMSQQSGLLRAAQALTSDLHLDTVLERLVSLLAELLAADAADCYLLDAERGVLRCAAVQGLSEDVLGFEFDADRGLAGRALAEGRPVTAEHYGRLDLPVPNDAYADFDAALVAPMRWGDTVQGVLGVGARGTRRFDDEDADLVQAYAGLASLALANAQAFEARSRQAQVQRGFFRIAAALGQSLSLEPTLEAVAQAANDALGGSFAAVLMPRGSALELVGAAAIPQELRTALADGLPEGGRVLARAAEDDRILASTDLDGDDRFDREWQELARRCAFRALIAVPVASPRAESCGLVLVFFVDPRPFSDEDIELARHLADAARGALERSELFEAERTQRSLSQQLARTGRTLATELDPAAVLDEVVQQAPALLAADAAAIRTLEDDDLIVSAAWGDAAEAAVGGRSAATAWLSGDVVQSRAPVVVEDASQDPRLLAADSILASGHSAFVGVPLAGLDGTLHGVLAVYARRPRTWRPEEIDALQALAGNTAAALSSAELYSRVSVEKERSVAILANVADGIVAVDRDGHVVLWNPAAEEITGVPADEALGRTPAQVLQRTLESDDAATASGPRLVSITRGGEEVWLSLSEAVMRDPLGVVAGRIFAFRDISADRMVEQVKSDFVAAVSLQLRAPLTSIYGFAETLLRQDVLFGDEERQTFLRYIATESERLTGIVDQLLNVARLDAGDLHVEPEAIDVASVVSEVVETVGEAGAGNGHRLEVDLPTEPLAAEADREKLRQVFSILVENALKYSPDGGTVTVGARRKEDAVEVRVVDEGIGIPAAVGLFIAKELVTAMGGRIWVESAEGEGASFAFELPAVRE